MIRLSSLSKAKKKKDLFNFYNKNTVEIFNDHPYRVPPYRFFGTLRGVMLDAAAAAPRHNFHPMNG